MINIFIFAQIYIPSRIYHNGLKIYTRMICPLYLAFILDMQYTHAKDKV